MSSTKKNILVFAVFAASFLPGKAQINTLDFVYGFTDDAALLLEEYMRPYANILGANLNAGWYNTAKPHKLGGLDITASVSLAFAPPTMLSYDLNSIIGLKAKVEGATTIAPTAAGSMTERPELVYTVPLFNEQSGITENIELARVTHPDGSGYDFLPMPMAQVTLGLVAGTDLTVRFVPTVRLQEYGKIGVWGIGGKHSISQWIPVIKQLKFFDIAVQGGYTKVNALAHLDLPPIADVLLPDPPDFDDQYLNMAVTGWTVNLIASQSIPFITVYEGIGYSNSLVEMSLTGTYPINTPYQGTAPEDFGLTTYNVVEDPISDLSFENYRNLRLNAGVRLKFGVFTVHYDFTKTLYATHTAGVGISFR